MLTAFYAVVAIHALRSDILPLERRVVIDHLRLGLDGGGDVRGVKPPGVPDGYPRLAAEGERCHPVFHTLIDEDKFRQPRYNGLVLEALTLQTCDRSAFLPAAVELATESDKELQPSDATQLYAVRLIGQIGTADYVEKLLPVLHTAYCDEVFQEVLASVGKLGDRRHALLLQNQLSAPRKKLPLTKKEQDAIMDAVKALNQKPDPTKK